MGVTVRVETNGASGVGNRLTAEEIAKAEGSSLQLIKQLKLLVSMAKNSISNQSQPVSVRQKN